MKLCIAILSATGGTGSACASPIVLLSLEGWYIGVEKPICGLLSIYVLSYMHFPCSTGGAGL